MNKSLTIKRLVLFLFVSFALVWGMMMIYFVNGGEYGTPAMDFILACSMLCPTIAVLFTRWITKEGILLVGKNSLQLGIELKKKKWVWYLFALVLPILYWDLGQLFFFLFFPETFDPSGFDQLGISRKALILLPFAGIVSGSVFSIGALGEEIGWRTYLYPKLEELFGTKTAVLVGGIIWGIWHAPAIAKGHGFGTGYWGEPWTGVFVFTVSCIAEGAFLYLVTKKTNSVWPAAFLHAINNAGGRAFGLCLNTDALTGIWAESTVQMLISEVPKLIMAVIATVMCNCSEPSNFIRNMR